MHVRELAPTELACCMRSCVRPVRLIQSWLRRKRARSQRCSFESPSVAYDSPEHCQSTKHGSTSNRTTSQKIKVRVYPITCPLCKGLVTSERMGGTADVRVRNMGTISCRPRISDLLCAACDMVVIYGSRRVFSLFSHLFVPLLLLSLKVNRWWRVVCALPTQLALHGAAAVRLCGRPSSPRARGSL